MSLVEQFTTVVDAMGPKPPTSYEWLDSFGEERTAMIEALTRGDVVLHDLWLVASSLQGNPYPHQYKAFCSMVANLRNNVR